MPEPLALVPKPTTQDEIRDSVLKLLRQSIEEAECGEIDCVFMILGHPDGEWAERFSDTDKFTSAIGRIEIAKIAWALRYLNRDGTT